MDGIEQAHDGVNDVGGSYLSGHSHYMSVPLRGFSTEDIPDTHDKYFPIMFLYILFKYMRKPQHTSIRTDPLVGMADPPTLGGSGNMLKEKSLRAEADSIR